MNFSLLTLPDQILTKSAVNSLVTTNDFTARFGLWLTTEDATRLVETRQKSLEMAGRIEFGGGILNALIFEFCDSPYIQQDDYLSTMEELLEIFYYYKNEASDEIGDQELLSIMKYAFDNTCHGSVDLLQGRDLDEMARQIRYKDTQMEIEEAEVEHPEEGEHEYAI